MTDIKKITEFEENMRTAEENKINEFKKLIKPALPIAILFCNSQGQDSADKNQIKQIFEGTASQKYQALDGGPEGLEFVSNLAEFISNTNGTAVNDVLVVLNANEIGFDVIRVMNYFDEMYYITTIQQAKTLEKLEFYLEEKSSFRVFAAQLADKAWEIYHHFRDEISSDILTSSELSKEIYYISEIENDRDKLSLAIEKAIDSLKHV
jgi:hypothetical protein